MYEERRGGMSFRDILIQLLFLVLFVFVIIWLFPTKDSINSQFSALNSKIDVLTQNMFADNLDRMKNAGIMYFTKERLPKNINDVETITLREMINRKLLVEFKDSKGNTCNLDNSYIEVIKLEKEYQMKVNLVCSDNEAYIVVHLGCYNYCEKDVCEKKTATPAPSAPTPNKPYKPAPPAKKCSYEYLKVLNGRWGEYGPWSNWTTAVVGQTDYRIVETKLEKVVVGTERYQTGQIAEYDSSKLSIDTNYTCSQGIKSGNVCLINTTDTRVATCASGFTLKNGVCYGSSNSTHIVSKVCPDSSYTRSNGKCYKTTQAGENVAKVCPSGYTPSGSSCVSASSYSYANKVCPSGYNNNGTNCAKSTTAPGQTTYTRGAFVKQVEYTSMSQIPSNNSTYIYVHVTDKTVLRCDGSCKNVVVYIYNVYKTVATTTPGSTSTTYANKVCPSGYSDYGNATQCRKTVSGSTTSKVCPSGYKDQGSYCSRDAQQNIVDATCPSGYSPVDTLTCSKKITTETTVASSCPSGYTKSGNYCYGSKTEQRPATPTTTYRCRDGYRLDSQNRCWIYVPTYGTRNVYENVKYYRYQERQYIDGSKDYKWSSSNKDNSLLNKGYALTGKYTCK